MQRFDGLLEVESDLYREARPPLPGARAPVHRDFAIILITFTFMLLLSKLSLNYGGDI